MKIPKHIGNGYCGAPSSFTTVRFLSLSPNSMMSQKPHFLPLGSKNKNENPPSYWMGVMGMRQRSTLPGRHQPSTIDVLRLNFCVRNGNRWNPQAIATAMGESKSLALSFPFLFLMFPFPLLPSRPDNCIRFRTRSCWPFPLVLFESVIKLSTD